MPGVGKSTDARDHRLRRRSPACCRRSSPTPRRSRCCCRPRSAILGMIANIMRGAQGDGEDFDPTRLRVGIALMLMLAYGASVGGLLTPVGSPPNLIGRGLIEEATGERISFLEWMLAALPICAADVRRAVRDPAAAQPARGQAARGRRGVRRRRARASWAGSRARRSNTLIAFGVAVTLWIAPGFVAHHRRRRLEDLRGRHGPARRGHRGHPRPPRCSSCCPTNWAQARVHAHLERGEATSTGARSCCSAPASSSARCSQDTGLAETIGTWGADTFGVSSELVDHDLRGRARDPDLGDDQQHGERRRWWCRS